jgi:hypothetical protein
MKTKAQERYSEYLNTDYWKRVSDAVKAKAGYRCQVCNSQLDLIAHHRTYEHRGNELEHIDDLTCLCRRCHDIFHGKSVPPQEVPRTISPVFKVIDMILVTEENHRRLKYNKDTWHWMRTKGIKPKVSGWNRRAIGHMVPAAFLHCGF